MTETYEACVRGKVKFDSYVDGVLYFRCENGLRFPVPIDEINPNVVISSEDQGVNFSNWIIRTLNIN